MSSKLHEKDRKVKYKKKKKYEKREDKNHERDGR